MKQRKWDDPNYKSLRQEIKEKKGVATLYFILRAMVIVVMIAQFLNGNFENFFLCILTLILFLVPTFLERKIHIDLPDTLEIIILFFIYAAEILGEIQEYYVIIPFWDDILHTLNGFLFAAVGFSLVNILNRDKRVMLRLSPFYMAVMAFCFSMTIGVLWEFFEFGMDWFFHTDMQRDTVINAIYSASLDPTRTNKVVAVKEIHDVVINGENLGLGGYLDIGLIDTMGDMMIETVGAVAYAVAYALDKGRHPAFIALPAPCRHPVREAAHAQSE